MKIMDDIKAKAAWLYEGTSTRKVVRACLSDGTTCMVLYRSMAWLNTVPPLKPVAMVLSKLNSMINGAVIGAGASFGERCVILHSEGIVINTRVRGGTDIVFESGVVIGEEKRKCPVLGNNIFVGAGAKIIGGVTIGDNVTIGANAVVVKDVPANCSVGGVPARIIRQRPPPGEPVS